MTNVTVPVGKAVVEAVASTGSDIGIGDRNHAQPPSGRPTSATWSEAIVYRTMLDDVVTTSGTGPGGHRGASLISSAAGSQPHTDTSDQSLSGPVTRHDRTPIKTPA